MKPKMCLVKSWQASVVRVCRGLIGLMSPHFGVLGSKTSDVEAISKTKKARTVKSGVGSAASFGAAATGPEAEVLQLVLASEWWQGAVQVWK